MQTIQADYYREFENEQEYRDKLVYWGLMTEKAKEVKKEFLYKGQGQEMTCQISGYIDDLTVVLLLDNGKTHCIHPAYLKEMQSKGFTSRITASEEDEDGEQQDTIVKADSVKKAKQVTEDPPAKAKSQPKKEKAPAKAKLSLPEDKVKFRGTVSEFATMYNHFKQEDDEVIVYKDVVILNEDGSSLEVGAAWGSFSATLKKLELEEGDTLSFEGKIADKKMNKEILYKINNPSKIEKM